MSLLYFPVFQTLLIGHLGITLGLLPLCAGYFGVVRGKPFWGGLAWSLLLLKPQFIPTVLLIIGALTLRGRLRCLLGCSSGVVLLAALTAYLSPGLGSKWISAMKLDDALFSDSQYWYPVHLVSSLPAVGLHLLPHHVRHAVKLLGYGFAALIGLHALWRSYQLIRVTAPDTTSNVPLIFLLGIGVLPVVLPHFLFYDLSILAVAGIVMSGSDWSREEARRLRWINWLYLLSMNAYLVLFMFISTRLAEPALLVGILLFLYTQLLSVAKERGRLAQLA